MIIILLLLIIHHWITGSIRRRNKNKADILAHGNVKRGFTPVTIINDQAVSLLLGIMVSAIVILHPGGLFEDEFNEMMKQMSKKAGPISDLTLFFEVLIMPPIIYESSLSLIHSIRVISRIGSLCVFQMFTILVTAAWICLPDLIFKQLNIIERISFSLIL